MRVLGRWMVLAGLMSASVAPAAEIDIHLSTSLEGVSAVKVEAVPVESGPMASQHMAAPSDIRIAGGEEVDSLLEPLTDEDEGQSFTFPILLKLFDIFGEPVELRDDDTPYDTTPIVDIFIDTDCDDCGDYDFTVPVPPGIKPSAVHGSLELKGPEGDARWRVVTQGNDPKRPLGWAEVTLLDSLDVDAPAVVNSFSVVPLDRTTLQFSDDLIFKDGEPEGRDYKISVAWLDAKGIQIGQKEIFSASATVARTRSDGTKIYKPWRFTSDLSVVVGETSTVEAMTDTWLKSAALEYTLTPLDGGPALESPRHLIDRVSEYRQKAQARSLTSKSPPIEGQVWLYQAQLKDVNGKVVGDTVKVKAYAVGNSAVADVIPEAELCRGAEAGCIPALVVRTAKNGTITITNHLDTRAAATTLVLTQAAEGSTGSPLIQSGQKVEGQLTLELDTTRVLFEQDFTLVFPSGLTGDEVFTYNLAAAWLDGDYELLGEEQVTLELKPRGGGWTWIAITHDNSGVRIR